MTETERNARGSLFWLGYTAFSLVVMLLAVLAYALLKVPGIETGAPRTAVERELRMLQQSTANNPDDAGAWAAYISALAASGNTAAARRELGNAYESVSTSETAMIALAESRVTRAEGDLNQALEIAVDAKTKLQDEWDLEVERRAQAGTSMLPSTDGLLEADLLIAGIHSDLGDKEAALLAYSGALEYEPEMSDILVIRGVLYAEMGELDKAEADYRAALQFIPDYKPAQDGLDRIGR